MVSMFLPQIITVKLTMQDLWKLFGISPFFLIPCTPYVSICVLTVILYLTLNLCGRLLSCRWVIGDIIVIYASRLKLQPAGHLNVLLSICVCVYVRVCMHELMLLHPGSREMSSLWFPYHPWHAKHNTQGHTNMCKQLSGSHLCLHISLIKYSIKQYHSSHLI